MDSIKQELKELKEDHKRLHMYYRKYGQLIDSLKSENCLLKKEIERLKNGV